MFPTKFIPIFFSGAAHKNSKV